MGEEDYSTSKLLEIEEKILSTLKSYKSEYVPIETNFDKNAKIWTLSVNTESPNTPLVMLHGLGGGLGIWCLNLKMLSKSRPVYAIDILGFGRSSKPEFSKDGIQAEQQLVDSLEIWRKQMKLDKIILLGHSLGAYIAALYAMSYPSSVAHLILADAWGFSDNYENPPLYVKAVIFFLESINTNPFWALRVIGPYFGSLFLRTMEREMFESYSEMMKDESLVPRYLYYCNAFKNPTGEKAFYRIMSGMGWAKNPLVKRIHKLNSDVPITFIYGADTWMDRSMGARIKEMRPNSYVDIQIIEKAGHHIYADQKDKFNDIVNTTCNLIDMKKHVEKS